MNDWRVLGPLLRIANGGNVGDSGYPVPYRGKWLERGGKRPSALSPWEMAAQSLHAFYGISRCSPHDLIFCRRWRDLAISEQRTAQIAPMHHPAITSLGQWTPR